MAVWRNQAHARTPHIIDLFILPPFLKNHVVRYTIYQSHPFFGYFFGRVEEFSGVWRETSALHLRQVAFRPLCHVPRFLLRRLSSYLTSYRIVHVFFALKFLTFMDVAGVARVRRFLFSREDR